MYNRNGDIMVVVAALFIMLIGCILIVGLLGFLIFYIMGYWKLYYKASVPEICCIIPFYNTYCMIVKIAKLHQGYFWLYMLYWLFEMFGSVAGIMASIFKISFLLPSSYFMTIVSWVTFTIFVLVTVALSYNLSIKFKKNTTWVFLTTLFGFITIPLLGLSKKNIYYYNVDAPKGGLYFGN